MYIFPVRSAIDLEPFEIANHHFIYMFKIINAHKQQGREGGERERESCLVPDFSDVLLVLHLLHIFLFFN
jgi:hypothetical protein